MAKETKSNSSLSGVRASEKVRESFVLLAQVSSANLGAEYLTDEIRAELSAYAEEELFSNRVLFVLRKKS